MIPDLPPGVAEPRVEPALDSIDKAHFRFGGVIGERIDANTANWLLRAPHANPGMLGMFAVRDRKPVPQLVPWAGEFAGKYLISAVQALRQSDDPKLEPHVRDFVARLIATQADDGYLGPFPKDQRLLGQWDLWGHYHVMLGLMLWADRTGDERALAACRRAADLVCRIYLDGDRRVIDAGDADKNMAIVHALAVLYRRTGERRYLKMALEVVKDFERAGDYLRTGLAGVEFYRTPMPRWESLHAIQGMAELYLATGDARYRDAFLHHWRSILRHDVHNNGSFSAGEQASGDPYALGPAIETCCTIAWQAITIDALRLTGDARIADELERTTYNAVAAAQHPSGSWCTYNTPMNGQRRASHHDIVFQSRAGTADLNCCSVNGPRGVGSMGEWAVMRRGDGAPVVNFYGPGETTVRLAEGTAVKLVQQTDYPADGTVRISLGLPRAAEFPLLLRIPGWCSRAAVSLNGQSLTDPKPQAGQYLSLGRTWKDGDEVELRFEMPLRYEAGDGEAAGMISVFRGPLLLAYDQAFNAFDPDDVPPIDAAALGRTVNSPNDPSDGTALADPAQKPWVLLTVPGADGRPIRLCDFASAGAAGTVYRSWLPAKNLRPAPPAALDPADDAAVARGPIRFRWRPPAPAAPRRHAVVIADGANFDSIVVRHGDVPGAQLVLPAEQAGKLTPGKTYYWKLLATNDHGETWSVGPAKRFTIDPKLPPVADLPDNQYGERPADAALVVADLAGGVKPAYGAAGDSAGWAPPAPGEERDSAVELDGKTGIVRFGVSRFPEEDYAVALWVRVNEMPGRLAQVFSAWTAPADDPLRVCIDDGGKLFARIEAGSRGASTAGVPIEPGRWHHVAAVKRGAALTLYLDGEAKASAAAPLAVASRSEAVAVGGNPKFTGAPEFLSARFSGLRLYARAVTPDEIRSLYKDGRVPAARDGKKN